MLYEDLTYILDIKVLLEYNKIKSWADRSTFYLSKMLAEQVGINKKYTNIKKCIGINILDFDYIRDTNRFHTIYHISEDTEHIRYTDVLEWHIVELCQAKSCQNRVYPKICVNLQNSV